MNGRIAIDGYVVAGGHEIHLHGGEPNPDALVSISMRIHNNRAAREILLHALEYIDSCIGIEPEERRLIVLSGGKE